MGLLNQIYKMAGSGLLGTLQTRQGLTDSTGVTQQSPSTAALAAGTSEALSPLRTRSGADSTVTPATTTPPTTAAPSGRGLMGGLMSGITGRVKLEGDLAETRRNMIASGALPRSASAPTTPVPSTAPGTTGGGSWLASTIGGLIGSTTGTAAAGAPSSATGSAAAGVPHVGVKPIRYAPNGVPKLGTLDSIIRMASLMPKFSGLVRHCDVVPEPCTDDNPPTKIKVAACSKSKPSRISRPVTKLASFHQFLELLDKQAGKYGITGSGDSNAFADDKRWRYFFGDRFPGGPKTRRSLGSAVATGTRRVADRISGQTVKKASGDLDVSRADRFLRHVLGIDYSPLPKRRGATRSQPSPGRSVGDTLTHGMLGSRKYD